MRSLLLSLIVAFASVSAFANSYSTSFTNENPSMWVQGKTNGGSWNDCGFQTGLVYGMQNSFAGNQLYADSTCTVTGSWGQNQSASGTVAFLRMSWGSPVEVELRINTTISTGSITGYEGNCSIPAQSGNAYCTITRWDGPLNTFTTIAQETRSAVGNGDKLTLARSGSTITLSKNGTQLLTVNDSKYVGGAPGVGFYDGNGVSAETSFGFSAFTANDGGGLVPPPASVSLSWQMPSGGIAVVLRASVGSSSQCTAVTNWTALATTASSSYSDSAVLVGSSYCYTILFTSGGIYAQASGIVGVDVTATGGAGVVFSAPPPFSPATNFNGSVLN